MMSMPSRFLGFISVLFTMLVLSQVGGMGSAQAIDLDWHGQFRAETHWLFGYSHGVTLNNPTNDTGYTIPLNGGTPASFQNIFMRLDPRAIVNDNVTVFSDIWVGTADQGMFGSDLTGSGSFSNTRTGLGTIRANEFYAELSTDFGTIRVGRAPLNWGLGVVWNNTHSMFDRLPSTGDVMSLSTKFGAFRFMPAVVKYRLGSNLGGTYTSATNTTTDGWSGASDYALGLSYENTDDQMEGGLLLLRRLSGISQAGQIVNPLGIDAAGGGNVPTFASYNYNIWDFYLKKKTSIFTFAAEVPIVSGEVASVPYSTLAVATKVDAQITEKWVLTLNAGQADGQESMASGTTAAKLTAFSFHPYYRPC